MNQPLYDALTRTHLSGLGLWWHLYPILQEGEPYGYTDMTTEDMATAFCRNVQRVRQGLYELKKSGVLIRNEDGTFTAPFMHDDRKNDVLRAQMKTWLSKNRVTNGQLEP